MDQIIEVLTDPLDVNPDVQNIDDLNPGDAASAIVEYMRGIWSTEHFSDQEVRELTAKRGGQSDLRSIFAKTYKNIKTHLSPATSTQISTSSHDPTFVISGSN